MDLEKGRLSYHENKSCPYMLSQELFKKRDKPISQIVGQIDDVATQRHQEMSHHLTICIM